MSEFTGATAEQYVEPARSGDRRALEELVRAIQPLVYGMALRFCWQPADAQEAAQEILVKVCTRLESFRGESAFTTWVGRVATNHLLSMRRRAGEERVQSFEAYAEALGRCPDEVMPGENETGVEPAVMLEEAKASCVSGMLLCLDREQRIAFILGAVLGMDHAEAAAILELSPAAFRKRLSRARADLRAFMGGQCGLVNPAAPCRCSKKTRAFVRFGVVDPDNLVFNPSHRQMVEDEVIQLMQQDADGWLELFAVCPDDPVPAFEAVFERLLGHLTH